MGRYRTVTRLSGEFLGFVAILVGGAIGAARLASQLSEPASGVASGLAVVVIAGAGFGWLALTGSEARTDQFQPLVTLAGTGAVFAGWTVLDGRFHMALGTAIGIALVLVVGFLRARSPVPRGRS